MANPYSLIEHALEIGALVLNPNGTKLRSGRISPYYFNSALFRTGQDIAVLAEAYADVIKDRMNVVQGIYGPPYKGIPTATALAIELWKRYGMKIAYASSRKEKKRHGERGKHIGHDLKGLGVAIVDDVITAGESADDAFAYVRKCGGYPTLAVIAFDRMERSTKSTLSAVEEFQAERHIPMIAAATLDHLIDVLTRNGFRYENGERVLPRILEYREEYGVKR